MADVISQAQSLRLSELIHRGALWPLLPAAMAMGLISSLRDYAFSRGLLRSTRVNVTVISIGNLIAGGSGKTPVVAWMLDYLRQRHYEPAVIARGYGGATAGEANDEAAMLGSAVHCHPQRATAAATAIASGANCLIMDDGLQHRKLQRDIDLLCIDGTRPWGWQGQRRGAFLPFGILREGSQALRRCHGIMLTRFDQAPKALSDHILGLAKARQLPIWRCSHGPSRLRMLDVTSEPEKPCTWLSGKRCWLLSAIARPQAFAATIRSLDAAFIGETRFPDHHRYSANELATAYHKAQKCGAQLVCTAKDAVKLQPLIASLPAGASLTVLEVAIQFIGDDEEKLKEWLGNRLSSIEIPRTTQ